MDRETQFLTVAVTRYADSCPPRSLHPDCPYAEPGDEGQPTCQEECRGIAVRLARPAHGVGRVGGETAYDARQLLLSETGRVPDAFWHTASLMQRLEQALNHPPSMDGQPILERHIDVTNALAYLGQRGFDPEALVRHGLWADLRVSIQLWLSTEYVRHLGDSVAQPYSDRLQPWIEQFEQGLSQRLTRGETPTVGRVMAAASTNGFVDVLDRWAATAPLADVVEWRWAPVPAIPQSAPLSPDPRMEWIVQRFTRTFLPTWSSEALEVEYRYQNGAEPGVPADQVRLRRLDEGDVCREIARRTVTGRAHGGLQRITLQAADMLSEGRRSEAAALFDALRIINPGMADAHNNYGFCLILDDPAEALVALLHARTLNEKLDPVNFLNEAVANLRLGRIADAVTAAEAAWDRRDQFAPRAWQWEAPWEASGEPRLIDCEPLPYLLELGNRLAEEFQSDSVKTRWAGRSSRTEGPTGQ